MRTLEASDLVMVDGAGVGEAAGALGTALGIGTATYGSAALGTITVGAAFAVAPVAVVAMVALAAVAGYELLQK